MQEIQDIIEHVEEILHCRDVLRLYSDSIEHVERIIYSLDEIEYLLTIKGIDSQIN